MVAQAIQDCGNTGRYYCEYRDKDEDDETLRPQRVKEYQVAITNRTGAQVTITMALTGSTTIRNRAEILSTSSGTLFSPQGINSVRINAYDTKVVTLKIKGAENYMPDGNVVVPLHIYKGPSIAHKNITVKDDDDRAYIGGRRGHPYGGGAWNVGPCCFTEGCAFSSADTASACAN